MQLPSEHNVATEYTQRLEGSSQQAPRPEGTEKSGIRRSTAAQVAGKEGRGAAAGSEEACLITLGVPLPVAADVNDLA